eukprot:TRINITY_DN764_c0_g1_i1.p1 TRINITY_DN764_c0_g1~~TRINITY_DN764_c0_g1_i1.p1  ORF type:complete len:148 (+),score=31.17 TRINITY_DN764_c0_g1_i1:95-538(+)
MFNKLLKASSKRFRPSGNVRYLSQSRASLRPIQPTVDQAFDTKDHPFYVPFLVSEQGKTFEIQKTMANPNRHEILSKFAGVYWQINDGKNVNLASLGISKENEKKLTEIIDQFPRDEQLAGELAKADKEYHQATLKVANDLTEFMLK